MHFCCAHITNNAAYIDYGNEPPPAATTVIHPNSRTTSLKKGNFDRGNVDSDKIVCMPTTCANKGVCYEGYEDDNLNSAYVREEYTNGNEKGSKWTSFISICDCDLTSFTGPTCEDGNEKCIHTSSVSCTRYVNTVLKPRDVNVI